MTAKKLNYEPSPCGKRGPKHPRGQVRADILAAAHKIFVRYHYQEATVRKIAAEAEVDPGLINYYFGTKQRLFREAMALPADPRPHHPRHS
ncbi:helix-turn-helix domain-containing protein [Winkia sp. UMB3158]|uniref:TetR/AcrR family transcriptional regulator n=1 Tax=unclassified Winkia TaxID=2692119 RepID=UPI002553F5EA|nr:MULTISPECIES: helix-turn-helix domain-containing protein [unclassified Winkia]MDK7148860.1 helix-turn-helix domain-containing protein [Winkia sp. UMB3158]MDK8340563.1 helix-turn-helix domain-containing protein [Winkia sp. UMB3164B]MDK8565737.1 helix-turn-helix domain-containing protein [Winkia sp. UMB3164A]